MPVVDGTEALVIEADASSGTIGQALCSVSVAHDLDIWEVTQGFLMIEKLAHAQNALRPQDKVVKILLSNGEEILQGGDESYLSKDGWKVCFRNGRL